MNIYVSKLNFRTTGESLQALFAQYGEVSSANIITDRETGRSRGFGSSHRKSGGFFLSEKSRPKRRNAPAAKYLQINADIPIIMPIFGNPDNRVHIVTFLAIHCPAYL